MKNDLPAATQIPDGEFMECSAKNGDGVYEVFDFATRAALGMIPKKKGGCRLA